MRKLALFIALFLPLIFSAAAFAQSPDVGYFVRPGFSVLANPVAGNTVCLDSTTNLLDIFTAGGWLQASTPPSNFVATTAPGSGNDSTQGYQVGSLWENVSTGDFYACTDASTGAAVWAQTNNSAIGGLVQAKFTTADWFSDFLVSGGIGSVPFSGFALTTPSATLYVSGLRVLAPADTFTYTASKDTYCFIQTDGTYHHNAVNNGNAQPTDTGFLTQKVVTNGSQITAITQIGPSLPTVAVPTASGSMPLPKTQADSLYVNNSAFGAIGDLMVGTAAPGAPAILHTGANGTLLGVPPAGWGLQYNALAPGGLITINAVGTTITISDGLPAAGTAGNILQDNGSAWVSGAITNSLLPTVDAAHGGTGLTDSGTDSTKALFSDGAHGFHMASGGSGPLTVLSGTLNASDIANLRATPKVLVAAQGANTYVRVIGFYIKFTPGTAYTGGGNMVLGLNVAGSYTESMFNNTDIQGATAKSFDLFGAFTNSSSDASNFENLPVVIYNDGGTEYTGGTGTAQYELIYEVVPL